ncbi:MAG: AAA family ATPase [Caldilineaceae bacterium]
MANTITPRYAQSYRQNELSLICNAAKEGQSLCLVGVAGTGKSNITNFLHSDPYAYKRSYLAKESGTIHFPVIDGNTWDGTQEGLWRQLLAALTATVEHLDQPAPDAKITQIYEDQKAFSDLRRWVNWLCQQHGQKIMFILDDFDQVIHQGPLALLEQFNALRSDGNRGKLSYLLFTKRLPHILGQAHPLKGTSKFYDLFSHHIYALGLYTPDDEHQMLVYLNESAGKPLRSQDLVAIKTLAGGHARLIKLLFELWRANAPPDDNQVAYFLEQNDVREECARILEGLHPDEQAVAQRIADGEESTHDAALIDHLVRRGLLYDTKTMVWFSPLFGAFLAGAAA